MTSAARVAVLGAVVLLCGFTCVSQASNTVVTSPTPSPSPTPKPSPTQASTPASITGIPMAGGEVGIAYSASLGASGGSSPYTWSLDGGALPGGLTLGADGGVSGVPTTAGTFNFTVKASDADNQYTTQGATIKIAAHLAAALIPACAQACYVEQGCVNVCGNFGSQSGGVGPFSYQASGNVPGGMKLNGLSLAGSFPQLAQFWQFNVVVTDALGATASLSPIFYVFKHITITQTSWLCGNSPSSCALRIPYTGGNPNGKVSVRIIGVAGFNGNGGASVGVQLVTGGCGSTATTSPPPAAWQTLSAGGGVITYTIQNPNPNTYPCYFYSGRITIVLSDQSPCGTPANCTSNAAVIDISV